VKVASIVYVELGCNMLVRNSDSHEMSNILQNVIYAKTKTVKVFQ
jgi:hypothetical protein